MISSYKSGVLHPGYIAEVCAQEGPVSMPQIMSVLAEEYIPGLPPGGGHPAK